MPLAEDIRKTLTDPTPLYFAAGVIDKIREETPERIAAVRATDPREVQEKVATQAKETQAKVSEALGGIDTDVKKLREQAQTLALQSVGVAAEYAVKARETYDELAERGRGAVQTWRGEEPREAPEVTVERTTVRVAEPPVAERPTAGAKNSVPTDTSTGTGTGTGTTAGAKAANGTAAGRRTTAKAKPDPAKPDPAKSKPAASAAKKTATRKTGTTAKKTAPKPDQSDS